MNVFPVSSAGGEGRPLRADAQRNREAILSAAEAEFRDRGVEASIDSIAERAGVGVGTVYRNYETKEALMRAIIAAHVGPLVEAARQALADPDPGAAFIGFIRRITNESCQFKALADSLAGAGLDVMAVKEQAGGELIASVRRLFERAQQAGAIRPDVTADDLATLIQGLSHTVHVSNDQGQMARCVDLIVDALRAPQASAPSSYPR
jgi:AcrR family transcriptional regulator